MNIKKLDLIEFKQEELSRENISTIKAGEPVDGKPKSASAGNGAGETKGDVTCYFDVFGEITFCINIKTGEIVSGFYS